MSKWNESGQIMEKTGNVDSLEVQSRRKIMKSDLKRELAKLCLLHFFPLIFVNASICKRIDFSLGQAKHVIALAQKRTQRTSFSQWIKEMSCNLILENTDIYKQMYKIWTAFIDKQITWDDDF